MLRAPTHVPRPGLLALCPVSIIHIAAPKTQNMMPHPHKEYGSAFWSILGELRSRASAEMPGLLAHPGHVQAHTDIVTGIIVINGLMISSINAFDDRWPIIACCMISCHLPRTVPKVVKGCAACRFFFL